jgi:DNA-binding NarL/FixJ family response regulator
MKKIHIIIVDDHQIIRDGIEAMLIAEDSIEVLGTAADYESLIKLPELKQCDVLILDIALPGKNGIEIAREFSAKYPLIKLLMLSANCDEDTISEAIQSGAFGFLHKDTSSEEFLEAVKSVYNNEEYFGEKLSKIIYKSYRKRIRDANDTDKPMLTEREIQVIKLLSDGKSSKEIAADLFISPRTVETHKANILTKLKLHNNIEIVKFAIKEGIVKL